MIYKQERFVKAVKILQSTPIFEKNADNEDVQVGVSLSFDDETSIEHSIAWDNANCPRKDCVKTTMTGGYYITHPENGGCTFCTEEFFLKMYKK